MTKKPTWQELLNIPNILTYFRFLFIPVFIWQYLHENYWLAGLALGLSALTDLLDGKIARKFDMITEIGILLDPVADKLTEAAVLLCLALRFPLLWAVLAICLTPFLRLALQYLTYKVTAALCATVAQPRLSQLIDAIGGAFGLVLGMTGAGALLLLVSLVSAVSAVVPS